MLRRPVMSESSPLVEHASSSDLEVIERTEWELCTEDRVPAYLRSPDIAGHYRVHFSVRLCLLSLVRLHNELLNIHTHLFGSVAFAAVWVYLYVTHLQFMQSKVGATVLPLGKVLIPTSLCLSLLQAHVIIITLYIVAVAWLLLCSSAFHCFNCRSPDSYACMARLDYSGIGIVILMSQWGAMYYAFVCWSEAFIGFASVLGVFTVLVVIGPMFRQFHDRRYRIPRALMYVLLSLVFPVVWWVMLGTRHGFLCRAVVEEFYLGMAMCYAGYGCGIFFYLTRFPERLFPGRCDLVPSHTFWHLGVLAGAALLLRSFVQMAIAIGDVPCSVLLNSTWYN